VITGHFVDAYTPIVDGVVRTVETYQRILERDVGPSYVVAPKSPGQPEDHRVVRFTSVPARRPYRFGVPALDRSLRSKLAAIPFDIVHAHTPFVSGELARRVARRSAKPFVFTLHSKYPDWAEHQYASAPATAVVLGLKTLGGKTRDHRLGVTDLVRWSPRGRAFAIHAVRSKVWSFASTTDCVLVPSRAIADELLSYADSSPAPGPAPRIEVVRQGIDFPVLDHAKRPEARRRVRARFRAPETASLFLFVGQLAREKEVPFLLDALAALRAMGQSFTMLLVGTGPEERASKARVRELGLGERVHFLGTIASKSELAELYAASDLFLFPSLYETQGLVVMEAASAGLPTVGQVGASGLSDVLEHDRTGFFGPRDPVDYAKLVRVLCANSSHARAVGERASEVVVTSTQTVEEISAIYRDLATARV
jgi:1,2-diacylglycerol 3-alpha-glucosyltransferase